MSQAHKFTGRKNGTQSYKKEMVFQVSLETRISSLLKKSKLRNENTIMEMWGGEYFKIEMFHVLKEIKITVM